MPDLKRPHQPVSSLFSLHRLLQYYYVDYEDWKASMISPTHRLLLASIFSPVRDKIADSPKAFLGLEPFFLKVREQNLFIKLKADDLYC